MLLIKKMLLIKRMLLILHASAVGAAHITAYLWGWSLLERDEKTQAAKPSA
jgi:hypothetical protein